MSKQLSKSTHRYRNYHATFDSDPGQYVLADLIKLGHILKPTFSNDPYQTAFNEGQRNMILTILGILDFRPADMQSVLNEQRKYNGEN